MTGQQRSFQIIPCPMGISSPHTHLVVSGRGVPHEPLTLFYEELQQRCAPRTLHTKMDLLLSFFSFLENPQSLCKVTLPRRQEEGTKATAAPFFPSSMSWAGSPSEIQAAVRLYLMARWGCCTRQHERHEDILLSSLVGGEQQLSLFLAVLRQFYHFMRERRDYWYEGNPIKAFRLPLRSRLLQAIAPGRLSLRSHPTCKQQYQYLIRGKPTMKLVA